MKKTLLALCAGILAISASAKTYNVGEAFSYNIGPDFEWFDGSEAYFAQNANWPMTAMADGASLEDGYGMAMAWFAQHAFETLAQVNEELPVVEDPWDEDASVIKVYADSWWAYGNLNFALPQVDKICRIRVVYRVDPDGVENEWYDGTQKPFHVRLTAQGQEECLTEPIYEEQPQSYWTEEGWRVIDLYYNLPNAETYLAFTFDSAGLTCGRKVPFYLKEVSVVPTDLLEGDDHVTGDVVSEIVAEAPEATFVADNGEEDSINEIAAPAKAAEGIYDLMGRKVAHPANGLYIINGVKTIVK